jgi:hypothetical protein
MAKPTGFVSPHTGSQKTGMNKRAIQIAQLVFPLLMLFCSESLKLRSDAKRRVPQNAFQSKRKDKAGKGGLMLILGRT